MVVTTKGGEGWASMEVDDARLLHMLKGLTSLKDSAIDLGLGLLLAVGAVTLLVRMVRK